MVARSSHKRRCGRQEREQGHRPAEPNAKGCQHSPPPQHSGNLQRPSSHLLCVTIASSGGESAFGAASAHNKLPTRPSLSPATRLTPNPTVYWPIAVWSILATSGEV